MAEALGQVTIAPATRFGRVFDPARITFGTAGLDEIDRAILHQILAGSIADAAGGRAVDG